MQNAILALALYAPADAASRRLQDDLDVPKRFDAGQAGRVGSRVKPDERVAEGRAADLAAAVDRAEPSAKRPRDPSGEPASSTPATKKTRALAPPRAPPKMPPPHPRERAKWRIPKKPEGFAPMRPWASAGPMASLEFPRPGKPPSEGRPSFAGDLPDSEGYLIREAAVSRDLKKECALVPVRAKTTAAPFIRPRLMD